VTASAGAKFGKFLPECDPDYAGAWPTGLTSLPGSICRSNSGASGGDVMKPIIWTVVMMAGMLYAIGNIAGIIINL
jgi:hypothetical protein